MGDVELRTTRELNRTIEAQDCNERKAEDEDTSREADKDLALGDDGVGLVARVQGVTPLSKTHHVSSPLPRLRP